MELRLLEYFLTVVREENISRAAEVLHVTQPTLRRQMKELEDELHTTLFIRGKRLTLTDSGVMLRRRAEEVVTLMNKIDSDFQEQDEISGVISVGSGGLKAAEILPELIGHFRERYPLVSFDILTGTADRVKEKLEHGLLDFGILLEPVDIEKFDYIRLPAKETWGLLMPGDKPFKTKFLTSQLNCARLSFAEADKMREYLHTIPGSVSALELIFDTDNNIQLVIDNDLMKEEYICGHPGINTSTVRLLRDDMLRYVCAAKHEPTFINLPTE